MNSEIQLSDFQSCAEATLRLCEAVDALGQDGQMLEIPKLEGREWYELLRRKLVPQLRDGSYLVAAVVGGTNIGKSVVFNHLAGTQASSSSPLASGTKHPVCLVPESFQQRRALADVFPGFELAAWVDGAALKASEKHMLFWQHSDQVPENLLLLDTPDIDSDAPVNWQRADSIRQCADVLIAVLTQQKYNDAAVKKFFRTAAGEDKAVIIVFNQCLLPDDEQYWPVWLKTFCDETGVEPEFVYVVPNDRQAAEELRLPFFERAWPPGQSVEDSSHDARNLREDLSRLHFAEVKLKSIRGSLNRVLDDTTGAPAYLREVIASSGRFQSAVEILSQNRLASLDDWPSVPNRVLVQEIRSWWQTRREGWSRTVHSFYNSLGTGLLWPMRYVSDRMSGPSEPPMEEYRRREWTAVLKTVEAAFERMEMLADMGNVLLRERLQGLLAGVTRADLLSQLETAHQELDLQGDLERLVQAEMDTFQSGNPKMYRLLSRLDKAAAVFRPATSVALFMTGFGPAGHLASQMVTDSAIQTAVQVASDVAGGTVAVAVGDSALSSGTASGLSTIEAQLRQLHASFAMQRVSWLMEFLNRNLWGSLLQELMHAAAIQQSDVASDVQAAIDALGSALEVAEKTG